MEIEVLGADRLRFGDGTAVRAASAVVPLGDGHLVVSDDATHAAWWRGESVTPVRLVPSVQGREVFDEASGTKHLKPDFESAWEVGGTAAVVVMGSGSSSARIHWCLVRLEDGEPRTRAVAMPDVYAAAARSLDVDLDALNLEGACVVGDSLRWFHRGLPSAGLLSASVDLDVRAVVAALQGDGAAPVVTRPVRYDLGSVDGVGLAITDVVALPSGDLLASAAAEDTPNARDDGPVVASALTLLRDDEVVEVVALPRLDGRVIKVEGLTVLDADEHRTTLLAVTDGDDPRAASWAVRLLVRH